jgi:sporulation protein YlmC with PRC-barrel domain
MKQNKEKPLRIEDILMRRIVTHDGKRIGRIIDIQLSSQPPYCVTSLLSGRYGLLHRLHVLHPFAAVIGISPHIDTFAWKDVERVERNQIVMNVTYQRYKELRRQEILQRQEQKK